MTSPTNPPGGQTHQQLIPADAVDVNGADDAAEIPRRLMRVKVLYTFDDQNKSNCLARLPNALNIPTVALDETTCVGVIELKTCIQAIVTASPELVAKLGHDYTVYAYDYSEYETPLVGQGMLSWILASASSTPNAPAAQSETMVTGRVCKNILGLFSNGVKETLEVKLKLVPVPTCLQSEYLNNMERYRSLSKAMPEGLDYTAWAEFLKANPAIDQLAQQTTEDQRKSLASPPGGVESFHELLTRPMSRESSGHAGYGGHTGLLYGAQSTRASSPAFSTGSYNPSQAGQDARPDSRNSFRSTTAAQSRRRSTASIVAEDQHEDGPPKKRARVTKAARPRKPVGANYDSLRVTASTAASVRLHRPVATNPASAMASIEQVPRAPTPRPGDVNFPPPFGHARPPAPSLLRHASVHEPQPRYVSPYLNSDIGEPFSDIGGDMQEGRQPSEGGRRESLEEQGYCPSPYFESAILSDNAVDSADDERGASASATPFELPSSPPGVPQRFISSAPSSPGLPTIPADSGYASDLPAYKRCLESVPELPSLETSLQQEVGDRTQVGHTRPNADGVGSTADEEHFRKNTNPTITGGHKAGDGTSLRAQDAGAAYEPKGVVSKVADVSNTIVPALGTKRERLPTSTIVNAPGPGSTRHMSFSSVISPEAAPDLSHSLTPGAPPKRAKISKSRGLPRSHTWSSASESGFQTMSDALKPSGKVSGKIERRKELIRNRLDNAIAEGEMPQFCSNCGEIETPTWRRAYTRLEAGPLDDFQISNDTGIVGLAEVKSAEGAESPQCRIFKQVLTEEEIEGGTFSMLILCNPCGLWLNKKGTVRPIEVWGKDRTADGSRRKRKPKPRKNEVRSDAPVLHSEPVMPAANGSMVRSLDGSSGSSTSSFRRHQASNPQSSYGAQSFDANAAAALQRAIQSSPPGFLGTRESPVEIDKDLTPKPTRRLLFPSPRRAGEVKSLADNHNVADAKEVKKASAADPAPVCQVDLDGNDKENCPPPEMHPDDDLAHLFEESSKKVTPTKGTLVEDLLKTPTPGSRRRPALTPRQGGDGGEILGFGLITPTRNTPGGRRTATVAPETPFSVRLTRMLSDSFLTSESQGIDFSSFSTFQGIDFGTDDLLSSDLPMPSSPPPALGFSFYEDPSTVTAGLWSGASAFGGSDAIIPEEAFASSAANHTSVNPLLEQTGKGTQTAAEARVDFANMIKEVVGDERPEERTEAPKEAQPQTLKETASAALV